MTEHPKQDPDKANSNPRMPCHREARLHKEPGLFSRLNGVGFSFLQLFHAALLDNQRDASQRGIGKFCKSIFEGSASVGYLTSRSTTAATRYCCHHGIASRTCMTNVCTAAGFSRTLLRIALARWAASRGVVSCTDHIFGKSFCSCSATRWHSLQEQLLDLLCQLYFCFSMSA